MIGGCTIKGHLLLILQQKMLLAAIVTLLALTSTTEAQQHEASCQNGYLQCTLSGLCIPANYQCDGVLDCGPTDVSDEDNCGLAETVCSALPEINHCSDLISTDVLSTLHDWNHGNFSSLFRLKQLSGLAAACKQFSGYSKCTNPFLSAPQCVRYLPLNSLARALFTAVCQDASLQQQLFRSSCFEAVNAEEPALAQCAERAAQAIENPDSAEPSLCRAAAEFEKFASCSANTVSARCGAPAQSALQRVASAVANDSSSLAECQQQRPLVLSSADCKDSDQQRLTECQGMLDQLALVLEYFHFSNPLSPTDDLQNFTSSCQNYEAYRSCMESVKHCYASDSSFLFMKATLGIICDRDVHKAIEQELSGAGGGCIRSVSAVPAMQFCLGNFSDIYELTVNEITTQDESGLPFCRVLNALRNFATCAASVVTNQCGQQSIEITDAIKDYSFTSGVNDGCIQFEPEPGVDEAELSSVPENPALVTDIFPSSPIFPSIFSTNQILQSTAAGPRRANATTATVTALRSTSAIITPALPSTSAEGDEEPKPCTPLQSSLLRTCNAPISSILENFTFVDMESTPAELRGQLLSELCTSYTLFERCYAAVLNSNDEDCQAEAPNGTVSAPFRNRRGGVDRRKVTTKIGKFCQENNNNNNKNDVATRLQQQCLSRALQNPESVVCSDRKVRSLFADFASNFPEFVFGDPESCLLSQTLQELSQCFADAVSKVCDSQHAAALFDAFEVHNSIYAQIYTHCTSQSALDTIESSPASSLDAPACSESQEQQLSMCLYAFEPYQSLATAGEDSSSSSTASSDDENTFKLIQGCAVYFLFEQCVKAARGINACNSSSLTLAPVQRRFTDACDQRLQRMSGGKRSCYTAMLSDASVKLCSDPVQSSFALAADEKKSFAIHSPEACALIRALEDAVKCIKPKMLQLCDDSSAQFVDKFVTSLLLNNSCFSNSAAANSNSGANFNLTTTASQTGPATSWPSPTATALATIANSSFSGTIGFSIDNTVHCDDSEVLICMASFVDLKEKFQTEGGAAIVKIPLSDEDFNATCSAIEDFNDCTASIESDLGCSVRSLLDPFVRNFESMLCNEQFHAVALQHKTCLLQVTTEPQFQPCSQAVNQALARNFDALTKGNSVALCEIFQALQDFSDCAQPLTAQRCGVSIEAMRSALDETLRTNAKRANCNVTSQLVRLVPGLPTVQIQQPQPGSATIATTPILAAAATNNRISASSSSIVSPTQTVLARNPTSGLPTQQSTFAHVHSMSSGILQASNSQRPALVSNPFVLATTAASAFSVDEETMNETGESRTVMELRLPDEQWDEALKDSSSMKHQKMSEKISTELAAVLNSKLPGFKNIRILEFSQGSVRVKLQVETTGHNATEVVDALNETIAEQGGRIGPLSVDASSLKIVDALAGSFTFVGRCSKSLKNKTNTCLENFQNFPEDLIAVFQGGVARLQKNIQAMTSKTCDVYENGYLQCIRPVLKHSSCNAYSCLMRAVGTFCIQKNTIFLQWQCIMGLFKNRAVVKCFLDVASRQSKGDEDSDPLALLSDPQKLKEVLPPLISCIEAPVTTTCGADTYELLSALGSFGEKQSTNAQCQVGSNNNNGSVTSAASGSNQGNKTSNNSPWVPISSFPHSTEQPKPVNNQSSVVINASTTHDRHPAPEPEPSSKSPMSTSKASANETRELTDELRTTLVPKKSPSSPDDPQEQKSPGSGAAGIQCWSRPLVLGILLLHLVFISVSGYSEFSVGLLSLTGLVSAVQLSGTVVDTLTV